MQILVLLCVVYQILWRKVDALRNRRCAWRVCLERMVFVLSNLLGSVARIALSRRKQGFESPRERQEMNDLAEQERGC